MVSAYTPLGIEGLNWLIIAEMDVSEIFKSVRKLKGLVYIVLGGLIVAIGIYGFIAYRKEQRLVEEDEEPEEKTVEKVVEGTAKTTKTV